MTDKMNLKITTLISILVLVASIIGSHYKAIADGKEYTDVKVEQVEKDIKTEQEEINDKLTEQQVDIAVIKEILIKRYGDPEKK